MPPLKPRHILWCVVLSVALNTTTYPGESRYVDAFNQISDRIASVREDWAAGSRGASRETIIFTNDASIHIELF